MQWAVGLYLSVGLVVAIAMANSQEYDHGAVLFVIRALVWPLAIVK